jgi:predicted MPP superfamily phosphohydrolase
MLSIVAFCFILIVENKNIEFNNFEVSGRDLPKEFEGFRIAHVSDLHNAEFGEDNSKLIKMLKDAKPDIIAITGDVIDSRRTNIDISLKFINEALKIAPCYYVSGNHESRIGDYEILKENMIMAGVTVLENQTEVIRYLNSNIKIIGISDPSFNSDYLFGDEEFVMKSQLEETLQGEDDFKVLLSHRPEFFELYTDYEIDLVLSGHAHGGQFVLPFLGGLFAPGQGFFPRYTAGLYSTNDLEMYVGTGIGNSVIPVRIFNPPEVLTIILEANKKN